MMLEDIEQLFHRDGFVDTVGILGIDIDIPGSDIIQIGKAKLRD